MNFLGLCRRAGKLTIGYDAVTDTVVKGEAQAVIVARDISNNTLSKLSKVCGEHMVRIIEIERSKEQMSLALGRLTAAASVTDSGFARNIEILSTNETGGNSI